MIRSTLLLIAAAAVPLIVVQRSVAVVTAPTPTSDEASSWRAATVEDVSFDSHLGRPSLHPNGVGFVAGLNGGFWRTEDAGATWTALPPPMPNGGALMMREDGTGLIANIPGQIRRTTDDGATWEIVRPAVGSPPPYTLAVADIRFVDDRTVLAVGFKRVDRSTDAGLTWRPVDVPVQFYSGAAFASARVGLVVGGNGSVLRTEDAGATWRAVDTSSRAFLRGVAYVDDLTVVAVGSRGTILRSVDGGQSWLTLSSPTTQLLVDVAFVPGSGLGYAVGFYGTILRTTDGGGSWAAEASGTRAHLARIAFAPDSTPVVSGWFQTVLRRVGGE